MATLILLELLLRNCSGCELHSLNTEYASTLSLRACHADLSDNLAPQGPFFAGSNLELDGLIISGADKRIQVLYGVMVIRSCFGRLSGLGIFSGSLTQIFGPYGFSEFDGFPGLTLGTGCQILAFGILDGTSSVASAIGYRGDSGSSYVYLGFSKPTITAPAGTQVNASGTLTTWAAIAPDLITANQAAIVLQA